MRAEQHTCRSPPKRPRPIPSLERGGIVVEVEQGRLTVGPGPRLSDTRVRFGPPGTVPGIDGEQIVEELGMSDRWEALVAEGVVAAPT